MFKHIKKKDMKKKLRVEKYNKIIQDITEILQASENMWDSKKAHAYIVGYLQGGFKNVKYSLESLVEIEDIEK